ncbi:MAG: hypothetical protein ACO3JG_06460 [Luteolibacter sp.]
MNVVNIKPLVARSTTFSDDAHADIATQIYSFTEELGGVRCGSREIRSNLSPVCSGVSADFNCPGNLRVGSIATIRKRNRAGTIRFVGQHGHRRQ